jgi:hypothetical protein
MLLIALPGIVLVGAIIIDTPHSLSYTYTIKKVVFINNRRFDLHKISLQ